MKKDPITGIRYPYNIWYDFSADSVSDSEDAIFVDANTTLADRIEPKASKSDISQALTKNSMWMRMIIQFIYHLVWAETLQ